MFDHLQTAFIHGTNIPGSMQYCSLQHRTLLPSLVTSTTGCFFFFFLLHLFILSGVISPESILSTYWPGELSFCLFILILFMGFSGQEYWNGLPSPLKVTHILSGLSTMTRLSWVVLHSMAHCFIEFDKAVVHMIRLVSFLWLWFSFCLPSDGEG